MSETHNRAQAKTVVGATSGIGSMLLAARLEGFEARGNIEGREYYFAEDRQHRNTFRENFPGAIFRQRLQHLSFAELKRVEDPTMVMGHAECGAYSALSMANLSMNRDHRLDPKDIPLTMKTAARLRPRFMVFDNLPPSLLAFSMERYVEMFPGYDLFPEYVGNGYYGNIQKNRNRFFLIGARREERFVFVPGEEPNDMTLVDVIGDLAEPRIGSNIANHNPVALDERAANNYDMRYIGDRPTWDEVMEYARQNWPPGTTMTYHAKDGTVKRKPGYRTENFNASGASTLDGGSYKLHYSRFTPLTIRERARIQGFPDDFIFYGTKLNSDGSWNPDKNQHMIRQTGKAMPLNFCRYVSKQIAAHIDRLEFKSSGRRLLRPAAHVDRAKQHFCETVGYANQEGACGACWLREKCEIQPRKYPSVTVTT